MISQSRAIRSKSQKIVKFVIFGVFIFFNCESTCDFTDITASIYDRKMDARLFDNIHDILRCISLVQSLLEALLAQIWPKQEPQHMRLLVTDRLTLQNLLQGHYDNIQPACLPQSSSKFQKSRSLCFVAGWGSDLSGKSRTRDGRLKQARMKIVSPKRCLKDFGSKFDEKKQLCVLPLKLSKKTGINP